MKLSFRVTLSDTPRPKVLVASHERSGTHFLLNTLQSCFGYVAEPRIDLDFGLGLNFHDPAAVEKLLRGFAGRPVLELFKSHHALGFLERALAAAGDEFRVFYVYRHPREVMRSLLRYQRGVGWDDGPAVATAGELMRAAPRGGMLRYQREQAPTVLERWRRHVEEWLERGPELGVVPIRYRDLDRSFEHAVDEIAARLNLAPAAVERPARDVGVVQPSPGGRGDGWSAQDEAYLQEHAGATIARLGLEG